MFHKFLRKTKHITKPQNFTTTSLKVQVKVGYLLFWYKIISYGLPTISRLNHFKRLRLCANKIEASAIHKMKRFCQIVWNVEFLHSHRAIFTVSCDSVAIVNCFGDQNFDDGRNT